MRTPCCQRTPCWFLLLNASPLPMTANFRAGHFDVRVVDKKPIVSYRVGAVFARPPMSPCSCEATASSSRSSPKTASNRLQTSADNNAELPRLVGSPLIISLQDRLNYLFAITRTGPVQGTAGIRQISSNVDHQEGQHRANSGATPAWASPAR